jgi:hypothetical protein
MNPSTAQQQPVFSVSSYKIHQIIDYEHSHAKDVSKAMKSMIFMD